MDVRRFRTDLYELAGRACKNENEETRAKVFSIANILVSMYRKGLVKINHSALELVCATNLIRGGYEVKVEHGVGRGLVCDVMGTRADGPLIIEIETGFIPPEAALEPSVYARSRIASKIARYSKYAGKFALGTTPSYVLDYPEFFVKPRRSRTGSEAAHIKALTDVYYDKPSISMDEFMRAKLDSVFIIDVDSAEARELDPLSYSQAAAMFVKVRGSSQSLNPKAISRGRGFNFGTDATGTD